MASTAAGTKTPLEVVKINKSNNRSTTSEVKKPRHQNVTHLWEFLLELLENDNLYTIISWSRREFKEFKLKKPEEVARRWGLLRQRKGMNYEKLSRALRFYYGQGIIQKVPGQRFTYKFDKLPYQYEPGVSRSLYQGNKMGSCNQEREKISSDKSSSIKAEQTPFSSSSGESALSPTGTPWGSCTSRSLVPIPAHPAKTCQRLVQHFTQQTCSISNASRTTLTATVPVLVPKRDLLDSTAKSIPVSVIKRVASNPYPKDKCFNADDGLSRNI